MQNDLQSHFAGLLTCPEDTINVAEQALMLCSLEYPDLDRESYISVLDEYADNVRDKFDTNKSVHERIQILNNHLFEELGFRGNLVDFKDPKNSYLNDVLDRKLGIPITLSLVYMEVGRRLGLALSGVSFPGHFLVRMDLDDEFFILDPFSRGIQLDESELIKRLSHFPQYSQMSWTLADHLGATGARSFLTRMLRNLKAIYQETGEFEKTINVANLILALNPASAVDYVERGEIFEQMDCFAAACDDFEKYLSLRPDLADPISIKQHIQELRSRIQLTH